MSASAQEAPRPAVHKMSETPVVTGMLVASICAGNVEAYRVEDGTPILTAESLASYTAAASAFVRCSKAHFCNIANGKISGLPPLKRIRIGRRVLFVRDSLQEWLRQVEAQGTAGKT